MTEKTFRGLGPIEFEGVRGVGTMQVNFEPGQQVYALIGENGVGKTKFLECLFTTLLFSYGEHQSYRSFISESLPCIQLIKKTLISLGIEEKSQKTSDLTNPKVIELTQLDKPTSIYKHLIPFVYLATHERGIIRHQNSKGMKAFGTWETRVNNYLHNFYTTFTVKDWIDKLKSMNMDTAIDTWLVQRAQSANPYQSQEDNREIEIKVLLKLLNQLDGRIDPKFLEIDGDNNVEIKIEGEKRQLSELSSGFTSLLKVIQGIIAGYGYLTNAEDLDQVQGIVLIDEIESHLHTSWQLKIFPLLKRLFPNTTFVVSTHSPIIISSLAEGEAYRLQRDADGVVRGRKIPRPNQTALVDLLQEAFGVSINEIRLDRLKLEQLAENGQKKAKEELAKLVEEELNLLDEE